MNNNKKTHHFKNNTFFALLRIQKTIEYKKIYWPNNYVIIEMIANNREVYVSIIDVRRKFRSRVIRFKRARHLETVVSKKKLDVEGVG